jgi:hypothetical protein
MSVLLHVFVSCRIAEATCETLVYILLSNHPNCFISCRGATSAASSKTSAGGSSKRLSRIATAAKSQTQSQNQHHQQSSSSTSGGSGGGSGSGKKGIVGMDDIRAIRATKRAQSISKNGAGSDDEEGAGAVVVSRRPFASLVDTPASRDSSPVHSARVADSPTMSDVSSVTATSAGLVAGAGANATSGGSGSAPNAHFGLFGGENACTKPLVRIMFEKYDRGCKGSLGLMELQELCYDFGLYLSTDDLRVAMHDLDTNGDGSLQYEEFMVWWRTSDRFR